MNARLELPVADHALQRLISRYSMGRKNLRAPAPSEDEVRIVAMAALRGPDHNKRIPFRFVVARDEGLERLAALFEDYGRRRGKCGVEMDDERARARQAPMAIAVVVRIDEHDPDVPAHEQWACVGGAIANALAALHFMGYGGKMVSGERVEDPAIASAFCAPGEKLLGWILAGTPTDPAKPRGDVDPDLILRDF